MLVDKWHLLSYLLESITSQIFGLYFALQDILAAQGRDEKSGRLLKTLCS